MALRSEEVGKVLHEAVHLIARTLDVDYCNVMELLPVGEELLLRAGVGWDEGLVGHATVKCQDSQPGFVIRSDRPVIVEDAAMETRFVPLPKLLGEKVTSAISVVISHSDGPYGALGAHTRRRRTFTGDEVHLLQSVANVLGTMIERRRADVALRESEANLNRAQQIGRLEAGISMSLAIDLRGRMKSFASLDCQKVHPSLMKLFSARYTRRIGIA